MAKFQKKSFAQIADEIEESQPVIRQPGGDIVHPLDPFEAMEQFERSLTPEWKRYVPVFNQIVNLWQYEKPQVIETMKRMKERGRI